MNLQYERLMIRLLQEISEMLAGQMSNQDEAEVEDELDALDREVSGKTAVTPETLPDAPVAAFPEQRAEGEKERWGRPRERKEEGEAMVMA